MSIGKAAILKSGDVKNVLKVIAGGNNPQRNKIIFLLSYLVGMRVHNIQKIQIKDVYDNNGKVFDKIVLTAEKNKGTGVAEYYLCDSMKKELLEYYKWLKSFKLNLTDTDFLIYSKKSNKYLHKGSIVRLFRQIYDSCGLHMCRSHSGRRSYISQLCDKGVSIHIVSKLVNHQSIQTTFGYYQQNPTLLSNAVNILNF